MWLDDRPTALYRLYDSAGTLLYVGITADVEARMVNHAYEKPWWPRVVRRTVEWHENRKIALAKELAAIRSEAPKHNVNGVPGAMKRREPGYREVTQGEAKGLLVGLERGIVDCAEPIFIVDNTRASKPFAAIVSPDFYERALAALGETAVPAEPLTA